MSNCTGYQPHQFKIENTSCIICFASEADHPSIPPDPHQWSVSDVSRCLINQICEVQNSIKHCKVRISKDYRFLGRINDFYYWPNDFSHLPYCTMLDGWYRWLASFQDYKFSGLFDLVKALNSQAHEKLFWRFFEERFLQKKEWNNVNLNNSKCFFTKFEAHFDKKISEFRIHSWKAKGET